MSSEKTPRFSGIVTKLGLSPMEAPTIMSMREKKLFIGIPKENSFQEHRIGLTPEAVRVLVSNGHRVIIESKAGEDSRYYDTDYSEAGAQIASDKQEVFHADIIIKIAPPTLDEIELLKSNQTLFSPIHLPTMQKEYIKKLMDKRVTAIAFEYLKDLAGNFPFVSSMSEIAGSSVVLIAAEYLSTTSNGKGLLLGGIAGVAPTKVVILGAGMVGTSAARAALGLGASVSVFDNNVYKLMRLQNNLGVKLFTSVLSPHILATELQSADVAIGAIHSKESRTPIIVPEETVQQMRSGSVIIDVSIDQGGCFETSEITSHENPIFKKYDVIHYCVPNIPARVSRTASQAISNILAPILLRTYRLGGIRNLLFEDGGIRHGVYLYKGNVTNEHLSQKFNFKMSNLELLFAADY